MRSKGSALVEIASHVPRDLFLAGEPSASAVSLSLVTEWKSVSMRPSRSSPVQATMNFACGAPLITKLMRSPWWTPTTATCCPLIRLSTADRKRPSMCPFDSLVISSIDPYWFRQDPIHVMLLLLCVFCFFKDHAQSEAKVT